MINWIRKKLQWDGWRGSGDRPVLIYKHLFRIGEWQIDLHKIIDADEDERYHSHPAWAYRIILWGWYSEAVLEEDPPGVWTIRTIKHWKVGMRGWVGPNYVHNIYACKSPTYTLWIRGPKTHKIRLIGRGWGDKETR